MTENEENCCDEEVYSRLYRQFSEDLYRFLYYKFGADNNPSDIVQEAFIKLWNNCLKVIPSKARAFLFTVASNHTLNTIEKKKVELNYLGQMQYSINNENPEFLAEEREFDMHLKRALEEMPETQRVAFMLNRIEKKKHKEIAEILGIGQKAVEKRIYGAVDFLKKRLGKI